MLKYKLSPAEKRLIREQSGLDQSQPSLVRFAVVVLVLILGAALALHLAYVTATSSGAWYAMY